MFSDIILIILTVLWGLTVIFLSVTFSLLDRFKLLCLLLIGLIIYCIYLVNNQVKYMQTTDSGIIKYLTQISPLIPAVDTEGKSITYPPTD